MSDIDILIKDQIDATEDLKIFIAEKMAVIMDRLDKIEKEIKELQGKQNVWMTYPSTEPNFDKIVCDGDKILLNNKIEKE